MPNSHKAFKIKNPQTVWVPISSDWSQVQPSPSHLGNLALKRKGVTLYLYLPICCYVFCFGQVRMWNPLFFGSYSLGDIYMIHIYIATEPSGGHLFSNIIQVLQFKCWTNKSLLLQAFNTGQQLAVSSTLGFGSLFIWAFLQFLCFESFCHFCHIPYFPLLILPFPFLILWFSPIVVLWVW